MRRKSADTLGAMSLLSREERTSAEASETAVEVVADEEAAAAAELEAKLAEGGEGMGMVEEPEAWSSAGRARGMSGLGGIGDPTPASATGGLVHLSAVQFCEKVMSGHYDPMLLSTRDEDEDEGSGDEPAKRPPLAVETPPPMPSLELCEGLRAELREALCDEYPELGFYVGMTLDEDGMLADGAAALKEQSLAAMELAVALVHLNRSDQPHSQLRRHCPALVALAAEAMPTQESLHMVLTLLAVRSLHRLALLVHDAAARVDELSTITVADLIEAVKHSSDICIPSIDGLAAVPEIATTAAILLACPFRFDRFALGESTAKQLAPFFQLRVSHGGASHSRDASPPRASQLLLVSCLGDLAIELLHHAERITPRCPNEPPPTPDSTPEEEARAVAFLGLVHSAIGALQSDASVPPPPAAPLGDLRAESLRAGGALRQPMRPPAVDTPAGLRAVHSEMPSGLRGALSGGNVFAREFRDSREPGEVASEQAHQAMKAYLDAAGAHIHKTMEEQGGGTDACASAHPHAHHSPSRTTALHAVLEGENEAASPSVGIPLDEEDEGRELSPAFVRLYCMLRWRPGAARHLQLAIEQLSDGDWSVVQRELAALNETTRRRELVLLDASRLLQACDEHSKFMADRSLPMVAAESHNEARAAALTVVLECMARLLVVGRTAMGEQDESAEWPYEVFCGNPLRVATTPRAATLRSHVFPRTPAHAADAHESSLGQPLHEPALPSQLELLQAARFVVLRATPHYAHLALEPPSERAQDLTFVLQHDDGNLLSRLRTTIAAEADSLGDDDEQPQPLIVLAATGDALAGDELALVLSRTLSDLKLIELRAVIAAGTSACSDSANARARLARGTLDALEMESVPVSIGTECASVGAVDAEDQQWQRSSTPQGHLRAPHPSPGFSSSPNSSTASGLAGLAEATPSRTLSTSYPGHVTDPLLGAEGYLLRPADGGAAAERLNTEFSRAAPLSLVLLVTTALTDLAAFIRAHRALFRARARRVVLVGDVEAASLECVEGVDPEDGGTPPPGSGIGGGMRGGMGGMGTGGIVGGGPSSLHEALRGGSPGGVRAGGSLLPSGAFFTDTSTPEMLEAVGGHHQGGRRHSSRDDIYLRPDLSAPNFALDVDATEYVFRACQDLNVQLVILSSSATAAAPLPSFVYDELATLGHPVALRLRESQCAALQAMWRCATAPTGHPLRRGFVGDRAWFARTFCGGADLAAVSEDRHIWPYVKEFNLLDPLGLLACHPATLEAFYEAAVKELDGVEHMVIGTSADRSGVRDCAKLRSYILDGCRHALSDSLAHASALQSVRPPSPLPKRRPSSANLANLREMAPFGLDRPSA